MFGHGNKVKSKLKKQKTTTEKKKQRNAKMGNRIVKNMRAIQCDFAKSEQSAHLSILSRLWATTTEMKDKFNASKLKLH